MSSSTKKNISLGKIIKIVILTIIGSYISFGIYRCSEENDVIVLELSKFNSPFYDFPMPIDCVRNQITSIDFFGIVFQSHNGDKYEFSCTSAVLQYSFIYRYRKSEKYIPAIYDLIITLDSLNTNSTRVTVEKINNRVQYGVAYWKTPFFDYYYYKFHKVNTSVIEEYDFLRLLGRKLGCLDKMPYTNYPEGLSRKELMGRYGGNDAGPYKECIFTEEEMFGNKDEQ